MEEKVQLAYDLISQEKNGILSTHSLEMEGYPFGSLTPYVVDQNGQVIILVSDLAQHTKNMKANPKVSLTISQTSTEENKQATMRATYLGQAKKIEREDEEYPTISERYIKEFPQAKNYFDTHDFYFYRLEFARIRMIAGFGKIYWVEPEEWRKVNF